MIKPTVLDNYFIQFDAQANPTLFQEAIKVFYYRSQFDSDLEQFLKLKKYSLHKHKCTGNFYGDCMGLIQTEFYSVGIFETIPLIQCYVIIDLDSGAEIQHHSNRFFHDIDILFQIRPSNPELGDFTYSYLALENDGLVLNSQSSISEIVEKTDSSIAKPDHSDDLPF
jgi:hypothetical protein